MMDIVAHGLWAGIGVSLALHGKVLPPRTVAAAVALSAAPDLAHLLPLLGRAAITGELQVLQAYVMALPGSEPVLSPRVAWWTHHLHCVMHSAVIAGVVTLLLWARTRRLWAPLLGWWSHIVIDVFTHSAEFYPAPVLYPFTQRGFDGLAWNTPGFMVVNYAAIAVALTVAIGLRRARHKGRRGP